MASWTGGECPQCGEWMPPNMVHCRECRQLLNPELARSSVEIPAFQPLQELDSLAEVAPAGIYCPCPKCAKELKIAQKYVGLRVQCKFCQHGFLLDPHGPIVRQADAYTGCPHCRQQLRFDPKYLGLKVACRFCGGKLQMLAPGR
jgi:hypothetical protein